MPEPHSMPHSAFWPPDPFNSPEFYDGVLWRRAAGFLVDAAIVGIAAGLVWLVSGIATVLTFGLLAPVQALLTAAVPLAYHTFLIGGPNAATVGMTLMGVEVRRFDDGARPDLARAFVNAAVFYLTISITGFIIVLVALFNDHRRTVHDYVAGTVVVRKGLVP